MSAHYECVGLCFDELKCAEKNVGELSKMLDNIKEEYEKISHLEAGLRDLTNESNKHKQFKSAKKNLHNILSIDDLVELATDHLKENKLLDAHYCLSSIDRSRDVILEEISLPKVDFNNIGDIKLVEKYFEKAKPAQDELERQVFSSITQMIDIAETEPTRIVNALRIIEREEE